MLVPVVRLPTLVPTRKTEQQGMLGGVASEGG
jgi:hypothetical protein